MKLLPGMALSVGFSLFSAFAGAQTACDPNDPQDCVQNVSMGESVPFPGMLMSYRRAAKMVATTELCVEQRALDRSQADEIHQIELNLLKDQRKLDQEAFEAQIDLMRQREETIVPAWYERPFFVAGVTVLATVGIFFAATQAVNAAAK